MFNGFKFLRSDDDRNNPEFKIYIFKNDDGIEEMIDKYKEQYGRKEN